MKIFLIFCFGFGFNIIAWGQPVEMVIDHKEAQSGDNVCLSVKICSSSSMSAIQGGIRWHSDILEFTELREDSIQKGPSYNVAQEGIMRLLHIPFNATFDSLFFELCFNVIGDESEYTAVEFLNICQTEHTKLPIEIVNYEAEALEFTTENGYVVIGTSLDSPPIAKCIDNVKISLPKETTINALQINAGSYDDKSSMESLQFEITLLDEPYSDILDPSFGQQMQMVLNSDNSCSCSVLELHVWDEANQHSSCNVFIQVDDPTNRCKPINCHIPLEIGIQEFESFHFHAIDLIASNNFRETEDVFVSINDGEPSSSFELSLKDEGVLYFSVHDISVGDTCQGMITVVPECFNESCRNSISFDEVDIIEKDTFSMRLHFNFEDTVGRLDLPISWDPSILQFLNVDVSGADINIYQDHAFEKGILHLEYWIPPYNPVYHYQEIIGDSTYLDFNFVAIGIPIDSTLVRIANGFGQESYVVNKYYEKLDYQRKPGVVRVYEDAITNSSEQIRAASISIFPNPATDYISVILDNKDIGNTIEIYNILGELEYSKPIEVKHMIISLNLLPSLGIKLMYVNSTYIGRFIAL